MSLTYEALVRLVVMLAGAGCGALTPAQSPAYLECDKEVVVKVGRENFINMESPTQADRARLLAIGKYGYPFPQCAGR